jgi:cytochrome c oxidase subunit 2
MVVLMPKIRSVAVLAVAGVCWMFAVPGPSADEQPQVVRVVAERFTFSPSTIRVKRGTVVEFRLRSEDTNHGFRIAGTQVNVIIPKRGRGEAKVRFDAAEPGRYIFECSKPCGAGHTIMRGEIIVE